MNNGTDVYLPSVFHRYSMYEFLNEIIDEDLNIVSNAIRINFHNLSFIEPTGVTILSNIIKWLYKNNVKVEYIHTAPNPFNKRDPINYLDDVGFFKTITGKSLKPFLNSKSTSYPLTFVDTLDQDYWLESDFIPWLSEALCLDESSLVGVNVCLMEVFNNIRDHAHESIGCLYAQHFPNKQQVKIAISDFGIGIPNKVTRLCRNLNDGEALSKAVEEGFSTKSIPTNGGAGLHTILTNILERHEGSVYIHSNRGILTCKGNNRVNSSIPYYYPGTLFEMNFNTNKFKSNNLGEQEEFTWDL